MSTYLAKITMHSHEGPYYHFNIMIDADTWYQACNNIDLFIHGMVTPLDNMKTIVIDRMERKLGSEENYIKVWFSNAGVMVTWHMPEEAKASMLKFFRRNEVVASPAQDF